MDLKDIKEYIYKKSIEDRLDTALLFFFSSLGIVFTLIFTVFGKLVMLSFLPTLFIGWIMPVYIGYIRGSLLLDLQVERARGWIYLIVGTGLYCIFLIHALISEYLSSSFETIFPFIMLGFLSIFISITSKPLFVKILEIADETPTEKILESYRSTYRANLALALFFICLRGILLSTYHGFVCLTIFKLALIILPCIAIHEERLARLELI